MGKLKKHTDFEIQERVDWEKHLQKLLWTLGKCATVSEQCPRQGKAKFMPLTPVTFVSTAVLCTHADHDTRAYVTIGDINDEVRGKAVIELGRYVVSILPLQCPGKK